MFGYACDDWKVKVSWVGTMMGVGSSTIGWTVGGAESVRICVDSCDVLFVRVSSGEEAVSARSVSSSLSVF